MREMKNSGVEWIGEIPATWTVSKLKNYIKCYDGRRVPIDSAKRVSGPYPYWGAGSITDYVDDYLFDEELILLGEDGAPFFDDTRPVAFLINEKIWANNHIHVIKPLPLINASFLVNYLNIVDYGTYINGSILSKLTQSNMNNISLVAPSLEEQHRIADFLDEKCAKIDAVIEKQKQVIEKLKEYKLSVITEAVTKGLDPTVPMKDSGVEWIGEIPEDWNIGKLRFFSEKIGDGLHGTPNFGSGDCFFVNGNNLGKRKIQIKQDTKTVDDIEYLKYRINLNTNTLLISLNGTIGSISEYHNEKLILGKSAGYIIVSDNYSKDYLRYYLQGVHAKTIYELSFAGTTINNLSLETLRNLPVCVFDINKQQEIARFLDKKSVEIDSVIDKKQAIIEKLTEYKKSLIYEVVTGKREVL